MKQVRAVVAFFAMATMEGTAIAQVPQVSDQQLYLSGQFGFATGNCVKASRYWFAYLLRNPPELQTDSGRQARLEKVIADCDAAPLQYASTTAMFRKTQPTREGICDIYAEIAVAQFDASKLANCGFSGSRWNGSKPYHYNWCLGARDFEAVQERGARQTALAACAPSQ